MNYEIITDRFEIEKMAEDMFLSDDEILVHIDYADLRTLKRHGTFKHAIICDIELGNKAWANELINVIQSQQQPIDTLQAFLMNIIVGDEGMSLSQDDETRATNRPHECNHLGIDDLYKALALFPGEELYIRLKIWRAYNDEYRYSEDELFVMCNKFNIDHINCKFLDSMEYQSNCLALLSLLSERTNSVS